MKYLSLDFETSINSIMVDGVRKATPHGPQAKDPNNDIHTIIYGDHPTRIKLLHSEKGFKRRLPSIVAGMLLSSHTIVGVNLKFDLLYIWNDPDFVTWLKAGGKVWDCQVAKYLLSGQRHMFPSLAEMQLYYLKEKTKESRISCLFKKLIGADKIIAARHRCPRLFKLYNKYSKEDGRTPLLIMQKQHKEAREKGMLPIIELYNEYLLVLCMMEHNGIPVNLEQAERTKQEFMLKMLGHISKAEDVVKKYWNDPRLPALNINSRHHASALLFGGWFNCKETVKTGEIYKTGKRKGEEKTRREDALVYVEGMKLNHIFYSNETKHEGVYQVDDAVVQKIYAQCKTQDAVDYCHQLTIAAMYKKMVSTYLDAFINLSIDGRISCTYNNTKVISGRLSASKPNLQNIPTKVEELKVKVQGLLCAPPGWTCASFDYSQLEIYIKGALSGDIKLLEDLEAGVDFHCKRLAYAEGMSYEEVENLCKVQQLKEWVLKRKKAKTISFQKEYGASPEKIATSTGLPVETVKLIFTKEDEDYWGVAQWEKNVVQAQIARHTEISTKSQIAIRDSMPKKGGKVWSGDVELLPIRQLDKVSFKYDKFEVRHIGYYQSPTGKKYAFEEKSRVTERGYLVKSFPSTQIKNYPMQGTAGDAQGASSAEMFQYLLNNSDKVRLIHEIHDSKWFLIKDEHLALTIPHLHSIMTNIRNIFIRRFNWDTQIDFKVDVEVGNNFAEMKPYIIKEG